VAESAIRSQIEGRNQTKTTRAARPPIARSQDPVQPRMKRRIPMGSGV
jgi:hypothetical protein